MCGCAYRQAYGSCRLQLKKPSQTPAWPRANPQTTHRPSLRCSSPISGARVFATTDRRFLYDHSRPSMLTDTQVFEMDSKQQDVYREVSPLVTSMLDGFNVCIFAYGQTGSGKTFTMAGPPDNRGVNTNALDELFRKVEARKAEFRDELSVAILEIYNENIRDLLAEHVGDRKLTVKSGPEGNYVPELTTVPVSGLDEVLELIELGDVNRTAAATDMNEHSSRSHSIVQVFLNSVNVVTGAKCKGKLNMIDLAGSERVGKSGATGARLKEAQAINKSLSSLGDVIQARCNKQVRVAMIVVVRLWWWWWWWWWWWCVCSDCNRRARPSPVCLACSFFVLLSNHSGRCSRFLTHAALMCLPRTHNIPFLSSLPRAMCRTATQPSHTCSRTRLRRTPRRSCSAASRLLPSTQRSLSARSTGPHALARWNWARCVAMPCRTMCAACHSSSAPPSQRLAAFSDPLPLLFHCLAARSCRPPST